VALFAVPGRSADFVADRLSETLAIPFERRTSSFWGDYCLHRIALEFAIRIYNNEDPLHQPDADAPEEHFFEAEFKQFRVLVDVPSGASMSSKVSTALQSAFPGTVTVRPS